jgi:hypothetical protein
MNLYFIVCCSHPMKVKVGYAKDPEKRLKDMQVSNPFTLQIVGVHPCKSLAHAREMEKRVHEKLGGIHVRGEWFNYGKRTARWISRWLRDHHPQTGSWKI